MEEPIKLNKVNFDPTEKLHKPESIKSRSSKKKSIKRMAPSIEIEEAEEPI
jgi:hypothetical protein